jgi:methionine-rich copper-binding protein CopC
MNRVFFRALAGVLAIAGVLLFVTLASAHSRPIRFDPPPGAVFTAPPPVVQGWFTSEIRRDDNWSFIRVADAQGARVDAGDTTFSSDRRQMSVTLKPGLGPGRYVVSWRTYDDGDGAIFGDCYTFFVGQAAADAAINDKFRLDAGSSCQRIDFEAKNGTPTASQVATATAPQAESEDMDSAGGNNGDDGSDVPLWALAIGVVTGLVVGGVGGRFLATRS